MAVSCRKYILCCLEINAEYKENDNNYYQYFIENLMHVGRTLAKRWNNLRYNKKECILKYLELWNYFLEICH